MIRRILVLAAALGAAAAPAPAQAPVTRIMDCTSGGCHAKVLDHTFVHGPTAVQACDACHEYKDPARHTFELKRQGRDLCMFCHIDKSGTEGPVVHQPVAKGQCLSCHDPHGSSLRQMLKRDTVPALCTECHTEVLKGSHAHKPAATDCTACHKAHTSDFSKLLTMGKRDLCISCHQDVGKTSTGSTHPHTPAQADCLQCHKPHASDHIKILTAAPADLCISCHQDVGKVATAASHPHAALTDLRSCLNCHAPHGSDHAKMLTRDTVDTCLTCHKQPIKVSAERVIASVAELADPNLHKHGPIASGDCSGCHDVHGGELAKLLTKPFASGFYQPFSTEAYALCFKCHDQSLALTPTTDTATGFREGTRNLHFVHVASGAQGRSCLVCHTVHASKHKSLIADSALFGQWKLPINFTPQLTGGSCSPGCHKPATYARSATPLPAVVPAPTTPAAPAPGSTKK